MGSRRLSRRAPTTLEKAKTFHNRLFELTLCYGLEHLPVLSINLHLTPYLISSYGCWAPWFAVVPWFP